MQFEKATPKVIAKLATATKIKMRVQLATCTLLVSNLNGLPEGSTLDAIPAIQLQELPI
ncbi:hypothetical protein C2G38_2229326 [Gigaspora rosea]|uniref:Uncharacterized protein n=1 Tax=Gigaspora rosea TaxID=44941 RepID=A0A397TV56_9GLOM|nr:hypothetical protein C2G38_2229326 [Gigaspora rosea]